MKEYKNTTKGAISNRLKIELAYKKSESMNDKTKYIGKQLGYGKFGKIYSYKDNYVCKIVPATDISDKHDLEKDWNRELFLLLCCRKLIYNWVCPNVPFLIDTIREDICVPWSKKSCVGFILDKAHMTMLDFLELSNKNSTILEEKCYLAWYFQIFAALLALQTHFDIIHGDLHLNNILFYKTDEKYFNYRIFNLDFFVPTYGYLIIVNDFGKSFQLRNFLSKNIDKSTTQNSSSLKTSSNSKNDNSDIKGIFSDLDIKLIFTKDYYRLLRIKRLWERKKWTNVIPENILEIHEMVKKSIHQKRPIGLSDLMVYRNIFTIFCSKYIGKKIPEKNTIKGDCSKSKDNLVSYNNKIASIIKYDGLHTILLINKNNTDNQKNIIRVLTSDIKIIKKGFLKKEYNICEVYHIEPLKY